MHNIILRYFLIVGRQHEHQLLILISGVLATKKGKILLLSLSYMILRCNISETHRTDLS